MAARSITTPNARTIPITNNMANKRFLGEVKTRHVSTECKAKRHRDCDGYVPRKEFNEHDHPCDCDCHNPFEKRKPLITPKE